MKIQNKKAFTLVELIIVITILAILATIGFMSYQSYTTDARDTNRIVTVKQISDGLDILFVKKTVYPIPDGTISTGSINGTVYAYRGTIGDTISQSIRMSKTVDPLSKEEYMYGLNTDKTQYQIGLVLENTVAQVSNITNTTYAVGKETAKVNGNYKGFIKYSSGSETWISNIPSLLWNNSGNVNLMNTGTYFVVDKNSNLPYKASTNDLGTKNADLIIQEITGTGISKLTGINITNIDKDNIGNTFSGVILASFGGDIAKVTNSIIGGNVTSSQINNSPLNATGGVITTYSTGGINYKIHTFSSPGTYNFSILSGNGTIEVYVARAGGGGGGLGTYWGAGDGTNGNNKGGHGGHGGTSAKQISSSLLTSPISVTVGLGGNGGAAGYNYPTPVYGQNGGTSSFGTYLSASGGQGQGSYGGLLPGPIGSGSGGDVNGGSSVTLSVTRSIPPINSIIGGTGGLGSSMATGGGAGGKGGNGTIIIIYKQ